MKSLCPRNYIIQLLVYSGLWLPKHFCSSLTRLSFFLRLSFFPPCSSVLCCHLPSLQALFSSLHHVSFASSHSALSLLPPSLSSFSCPCHRREMKKQKTPSLRHSLFISVLPYPVQSFISLLRGASSQTHPSLVRRWADSPLLWAAVWLTRPVSFIADKEAHCSLPFWSAERGQPRGG